MHIHIKERWNEIELPERVNIIGDPGCDGLGASTMAIFAKALSQTASFNIILGDLVPTGEERHYNNIKDFIDEVSHIPAYTLCGNHDTDHYDSKFGLRSYALHCDDTLFIILDNSSREFSDETSLFAEETLKRFDSCHCFLFFHIPPPNSISDNSISDEAWLKLYKRIEPYRDRLKGIFSGHVHGFFESDIDGIPLYVSGGGGARIEPISSCDEKKQKYHTLQLKRVDSCWEVDFQPIESYYFEDEFEAHLLEPMLEKSLRNEESAHFRYRLYADEAASRGKSDLADLFTALADAEYQHARNHYFILNRYHGLRDGITSSIEKEKLEISTEYPEYLEYARERKLGLASYSFKDALEAEKVHHKLLNEALDKYESGNKIEKIFHTCSSCGYTFASSNGEERPKRCPICGAPEDKIYRSRFK